MKSLNLVQLVNKYAFIFLNNKFLSVTGIYVIGNLLQRALGFILIPLYTKFLTPGEYGVVGVAVSVLGVFTTIFGMGIPSSIARLYFDHRDSEENLKIFVSSNFIFIATFLLIIVLFFNFFGGPVWDVFFGSNIPFYPIIQIVLWNSYADILIQIPQMLYRSQQKAKQFISLQVSNFVLSVVLAIIFVGFLKQGAKGPLLGSLIGSAIIAFRLVILMKRDWGLRSVKFSYIRDSILYGLPLVAHSLSAWIMTFADRLLLESRISLDEVGYYTLGYQVGMVMSVLVLSINFAYSPYYYDLLSKKVDPRSSIKRISNLYVSIVGSICLILILFSSDLLFLVTPPEYLRAARFIPLILLSYLFNGYYYLLSMPLFYYKKTGLIPIITVTGALLNIVLNLLWIPKLGALGSTWATLIVYTLSAIIAYFLGRRYQLINYDYIKIFIVNLFLFVAALFMTYTVQTYLFQGVIYKLLILAIFLILIYYYFLKLEYKKLFSREKSVDRK